MKIYVSDIGDRSVGIQELTIATLDIHESMVEVLEQNNQMHSFKQELKRFVEEYCEPEVSYEVYSDKDIEEEAKWEEEYERELLKGFQQDEEVTEEYRSEKPSVVDILSGKVDIPSGKIVNVIGAKTGR